MSRELLICIVDCSDASWAAVDSAAAAAASASAASASVNGTGGDSVTTPAIPVGGGGRRPFPEFLTQLNLFLGAYCALGRRNALAVLGFNDDAGDASESSPTARGGYVWPPLPPSGGLAAGGGDMLRPAVVGRAVEEGLARLRYGDAAVAELLGAGDGGDGASAAPTPLVSNARLQPRYASLAACLSLGMCHYASMAARVAGGYDGGSATAVAAAASGGDSGAVDAGGSGAADAGGASPANALRARVLVFVAGADREHSYTDMVNAVFSAQRFGIPVDAVVLGAAPSTVLQQAAELTHGLYTSPAPEHHALLFQLLVSRHLPDVATRELMLLPPAHAVDLRASCRCHRRLVDLAFVCSICLAVWCAPQAVCGVCGAEMAAAANA